MSWVDDIFKPYDEAKAKIVAAGEKACKDAVTKKILDAFKFNNAWPFYIFVVEIGIVALIARRYYR